MRKILSILVLVSGFLCSLNTLGQGSYKISVKINGVKDSACYLANYYGDKQYLKDTAKADNSGKMVFEGKPALPGGIYLVVIPGKRYFEVIIDKEQNFSIETDTSDFIKNMKIKGSEENKLFYDYLNFIGKKGDESLPYRKALERVKNKKDSLEIVRKKLGDLDKEVKDYRVNLMEKYPNSFTARIFKTMWEPETPKELPKLPNGKTDSAYAFKYFKSHYFDNLDFSDERLIRTPLFHNKIEFYFKNLVVQTPDSINAAADYVVKKARANKELFKYVVWYITYHYETSNIMGMEGVFVHMVENYYTKNQAYWLDSAQTFRIMDRAKSLKPLLVGKKAPALILEDTLGKPRNMYDIKAKYTVLLFWDPDCGHCQKDVPRLAAAYDSLKALNAEVYAADGAVEDEKWRKFIKKHNLKWINVADMGLHNYFRTTYDLKSYPQMYILNEKKEIIARKIGVGQVVDFIKRYDDMEIRKKLIKDLNQ